MSCSFPVISSNRYAGPFQVADGWPGMFGGWKSVEGISVKSSSLKEMNSVPMTCIVSMARWMCPLLLSSLVGMPTAVKGCSTE